MRQISYLFEGLELLHDPDRMKKASSTGKGGRLTMQGVEPGAEPTRTEFDGRDVSDEEFDAQLDNLMAAGRQQGRQYNIKIVPVFRPEPPPTGV